MGIKLVVAVTDNEWFRTLRASDGLREINFWSPSAIGFRSLKPGELFLFKLKKPYNAIAGGGIFVHANQLPCSLAWEAFGVGNGAESLGQMREMIRAYRKSDGSGPADFKIGCRVLVQPVFLDENEWIPVPPSWSPSIMRHKRFDTDEADGRRLWEEFTDRLAVRDPAAGQSIPDRFGTPQIIRPRLGQGAFRIVVTDNYQRRCAVTGERTFCRPSTRPTSARIPTAVRGSGAGRSSAPASTQCPSPNAHWAPVGLLFRTDIHPRRVRQRGTCHRDSRPEIRGQRPASRKTVRSLW